MIASLHYFSFFFCILFSQASTFGQNYFVYRDSVRIIAELLAKKEFSPAILKYNYLFANYKRVFAKDAYNACQIAALENDINFKTFYCVAAKSGVPQDLLVRNFHIRKITSANTKMHDSLFFAGRTEYLNSIDTVLRREFITRFQAEQRHKADTSYPRICKQNFERILQLAEKGSFPGEHVIGVDAQLENSFVFATLKHYPYSYKILEKYLAHAIQKGEAQSLAVYYVYSFNQTKQSRLYANGPDYSFEFATIYNLPFGKQSDNFLEVNQNRKTVGIISCQAMDDLIFQVNPSNQLDIRLGY